jgi:hypothetical protein
VLREALINSYVLFLTLTDILYSFTYLFIFGDYRTRIVRINNNIAVMKTLSASLKDFYKKSEAAKGNMKVTFHFPTLSNGKSEHLIVYS